MKVLVVDDEKTICDSIVASIDWPKAGYEILPPCYDGIEAMDIISDEMPEIVITDIQMPGLTGLDLISRAHSINPDSHFIILSGYSEFSYAQTAMLNGVTHYLLKPSSPDEILEAVNQLSSLIKKQNDLIMNGNLHNDLEQKVLKLILQKYIFESLSVTDYKTVSRNEISSFSTVNTYVVFVYYLEKDNIEPYLSASKDTIDLLPNKTLMYVENTLMIISVGDTDSKIQHVCNNLRNENVGAFALQSVKDQCFFSFQALMDYLIPRIKRYSVIYFFDDTNRMQECMNYSNIFSNIKKICMDNMDVPNAIMYKISKLYESINDLSQIRVIAINILEEIDQIQYHDNQVAYNLPVYLKRLSELDNKEQIIELINRFVNESIAIRQGNKTYKEFVIKIFKYTQEHYDKPFLSLKFIADNELYMNADYVSREFFHETGMKYSDYLWNARIEKAKELLLTDNRNATVYQVSELIGCSNAQYFSQIFKKYTGESPTMFLSHNKKEGLHVNDKSTI